MERAGLESISTRESAGTTGRSEKPGSAAVPRHWPRLSKDKANHNCRLGAPTSRRSEKTGHLARAAQGLMGSITSKDGNPYSIASGALWDTGLEQMRGIHCIQVR